MRVLVAFDKFKDALTADQACEVAVRALRGLHPDWQFDLCPLADGGEGFAGILTQAAHGRLTMVQVAGPRGGLISAPIGLVALGGIPTAARSLLALPDLPGDPRIAVIEMAAASGLALLPAGIEGSLAGHVTGHRATHPGGRGNGRGGRAARRRRQRDP